MAQLAMLGGGGGGIMSLMLPMFSSVIGMFMQPGQKEEQGKLNDLKVSTSAYGQGIAIVYGTMRVPGNMFWATQFEEEKRYINSKGKDVTGKKKDDKKGKPVFEYYANFAMGLCEGPVGEILRIWADSNLIYDKYNPNNEDLVEIGFSQGENGGDNKMGKGGGTGKKGGSQESGRFQFRFYNGSESQLADPHMVAKNLQFNQTPTPAHRGLCYLYFEHFALMDFGNRTPTITAEVTREHERRPIFTNFLSLEKQNIETTVPPGDGNFSKLFMDPVHMKIYTTADGILRQWDMDTRVETKRVRISDIKGEKVAQISHPAVPTFESSYYTGETLLFNGLGGVNYRTSMVDMGTSSIVGIAASGDLIGLSDGGGNNSKPIVFIDPQSMTIKNRFGRFGNGLGAGSYSIEQIRGTTLLSYFDVITKTPYYFTAVVGVFGALMFFNDKNEPMNYWDVGGSIFGDQGTWLAPGLPSSAGATFYATQAAVLFSNPVSRLIRYEADNSLDSVHGQSTVGQTTSMQGIYKKRRVIYESLTEDDETARYMTQPYPLSASESVCFIEFVVGNTVNPEKNGAWAVKIDLFENRDHEFEVKWRAKISNSIFDHTANSCTDSVVLTGHRLVIRYDQTTVWDIDFTAEKIDMWYLPQEIPPNSRTQMYLPAKGALIMENPDTTLEDSGVAGSSIIVEAMLDRMIQKKITAAEILFDLADRVGIGRERINATKLNDDQVTGYVVQQPKAARHVADDLMKVFFFDMAESDYTLKAVSRSQSTSAVTVLQPDLGFIDGGTPADNASDYYKETRVQEIDLPATVMITYIDPKDDYESGEQHWRRPRSPMAVMQSKETLDINLPMALEADFAKQTAQKIVYSAWSERAQYEFALPWKFIKYDPTDVMTFVMTDGLTFQARMSNMDLGQDFSIRASGVATEMASYLSTVKAQGNGRVVPVPHFLPPHVRAEVFNIPYFEDVDSVGDSGFQYYWGLKSFGPGFRVGSLSSKLLPNGQWNGLGMTPFDMPWGTVLGFVPAPPWGTAYPTDDISRLRLMPAFDFQDNPGMYEWESIPDEQWPSHRNTLLINDEIIYFKDVEIGSNGVVTVSNLIRGARGTINASYSHLTGENWYIVNAAFQDELESFANVGETFAFRPSAPSLLMSGLPTIQKKLTGASHKPWAPNMFKRSISGGTNLVFTWERNTRLGGTLKEGTGTVPLVDIEEYEFYILNGPYVPLSFDSNDPTTYKRKFDGLTSKTITYTAAMLAADGFTINSTIHVVAIQRNAFVGRGFPGWHTTFPGY